MAHSFSGVYVHIVFSTKDRRPILEDTNVRQDLHRYIAGIVDNQSEGSLIVGGVEDHVHLLVRLGRSVSLADLVREVKRSSSQWIKGKGPLYREFAWQQGYAAVSVCWRDLDSVRTYIAGQAEHHRKRTFEEEYKDLLLEHGIPLDAYMWE